MKTEESNPVSDAESNLSEAEQRSDIDDAPAQKEETREKEILQEQKEPLGESATTDQTLAGDTAPETLGQDDQTPGTKGQESESEESQKEQGESIVITHEAEEGVMPYLEELEKQMKALNHAFEVKLKYDQQKEKTIDRLHNELTRYKNDLISTLLKPVLMDVIQHIDKERKWLAGLKKKHEKGELSIEKLLRDLEGMPAEWEEIIERQGVQSYQVEGEGLEGKKQKVISTEITEQPGLHKTIAKRVASGYEWAGKTLRKEEVIVYKYQQETEES